MRWLAKAALQRGLGALPQGERLNYVFQRRVLHSFPIGDTAFRQKFTRAVNHLAAYEEHGPGVPPAEATFFEFGAGWDLAIPLAYSLLGVGRQVIVDIRPSARTELVRETIAAFGRLRPELEEAAGRGLRDLGGPGLLTRVLRMQPGYLVPRGDGRLRHPREGALVDQVPGHQRQARSMTDGSSSCSPCIPRSRPMSRCRAMPARTASNERSMVSRSVRVPSAALTWSTLPLPLTSFITRVESVGTWTVVVVDALSRRT